MTKGRVKGVLSATIYITCPEDVIGAMLELGKVYKDADIDNDDNYIFLNDEEYANYYYSPPVYYTRNGDGSPEEYEDELTYFDKNDAIEDIQKALKNVTYEIESITYERVYEEERF